MWARSGRELFFVDSDQRLVAAELETASGFGVLGTEPLFTLGVEYFLLGGTDFYDIAADDQRFLMARLAGGPGGPDDDSRFILVTNWFEELSGLVGN